MDAPVSGGPEGAQKGALSIMVGGMCVCVCVWFDIYIYKYIYILFNIYIYVYFFIGAGWLGFCSPVRGPLSLRVYVRFEVCVCVGGGDGNPPTRGTPHKVKSLTPLLLTFQHINNHKRIRHP